MAEIRRDQLENASKFMSAFWEEMVKPFYNSEDADEYWLKLIDKGNELHDRFNLNGDDRLKEMLFGFCTGLEIKAGGEPLSYLERFYRKLAGKE